MKRQLQGIALILVSILLMLGYGDVAFFDLSFKRTIGISIQRVLSQNLSTARMLCPFSSRAEISLIGGSFHRSWSL